jgi:glycosyltransferase involved in cell wall biosynthesis
LKSIVREEHFDLVWVHFLNMLGLLYDTGMLLDELEDVPIVLDQHNDMERFWTPENGHGTVVDRGWARWNVDRVRRLRCKVLPHCDIILSVSREDAESTRRVVPDEVPVWVVPNGVELGRFEENQWSPSSSHRLLFVGSMDVRMNVDAVTWFTKSIFPKLRHQVPDVQFDIVGRSPTSDVQALANEDGVHVTGRVKGLRQYYERASIAVVPSRLGGGTKLKVPEAMAAGVPVVATSVGAQGLDLEDETHLQIADDEEEFARSTAELLRNSDKARRIAEAARMRVEERYSWSGIYDNAIDRLESEGVIDLQ